MLDGNVGGRTVSFTGNPVSSVLAIIAVPLFVIYCLIDGPKIRRQVRGQSPRAGAGDALALVHIFSRVIGSYTRGVIVESIIVGVISALGYYVIGIQVWLPLAVIALIGEIVPIIGPWIAFVISLLVILATQPDKALLALGLFVIIQILEVLVLTPRIQGASVNLTPLVTLVALAIGGAIGGPLGVILVLPAVALTRNIASYTSYRAGGSSPAQAMARLPSRGRHHEGDRALE